MNVQDRQTIKQQKKVLLSLVFNQSIECHPFPLSTLLFIGFIILCYRCMFTPYRIAFAPPQKSSRRGLLFIHNNSDFIGISLLKRSCTVPISKVESQYTVNWIVFQGRTKSYLVKCEHALNSRKMDGACLGLKFAKRATLKAWEKISVLCESFFFFSAPVINCDMTSVS